MSETAVWIVEDQQARLRRAAFIRALHADLLELVQQTAEPRIEPPLPRVSMRHPKRRVSRPSKALRTGGKR